jgi:hypothetical protein
MLSLPAIKLQELARLDVDFKFVAVHGAMRFTRKPRYRHICRPT